MKGSLAKPGIWLEVLALEVRLVLAGKGILRS
jgi:hypothetical protein